jgi:hypothetical protein
VRRGKGWLRRKRRLFVAAELHYVQSTGFSLRGFAACKNDSEMGAAGSMTGTKGVFGMTEGHRHSERGQRKQLFCA